MGHLASVANKRLTANLNPLDATLTKKRGEGAPLGFQLSARSLFVAHAPRTDAS